MTQKSLEEICFEDADHSFYGVSEIRVGRPRQRGVEGLQLLERAMRLWENN
jgi:hypothetical protein